MLDADFVKYSLVLIKGDKQIYSSNKSGLKPLVECIKIFKSKFKGCTLYDRVVGLAAARLIVYSNMISLVVTQVSSKSAKELLDKNSIEVKTQNIADNILTKDRLSTCPMEVKAKTMDNESFFLEIKDRF